jgi:hypothetical protein
MKRPKRLFRDRPELEQKRREKPPVDSRLKFRRTMLQEHIEDLASKDAPCIVCQRPHAELVGGWEVSEEFGQRIGVPGGKMRVYFYPICRTCEQRGRAGDRWVQEFIEAKIIARARGENIVYLDPEGMPVVDPGDEPLPGPTHVI